MAKCINDCGNEAVGRSKYCSDKCKVAWNRNKRNTKSVTSVTEQQSVTSPSGLIPEPVGYTEAKKISAQLKVLAKSKSKPANFGQPDCECMHCQQNKANHSKHVINHGPYKKASQMAANELNRVSLPGDVDYAGVASRKGFNE